MFKILLKFLYYEGVIPFVTHDIIGEGIFMKKLAICLFGTFLCALSFAEEIAINENWTGTILGSNTTYVFGANDLSMTHTYTGPRHLSSTVVFDLGSHMGIEIVDDANVINYPSNYFGWNGATITGDYASSANLSATDNATPLWISGIKIERATVNLNYGDKVAIMENRTPTFTISDNATLIYNTAFSESESSATNILFSNPNTDTLPGQVIFTDKSLTTLSDSTKAIYNASFSGNLIVQFDNSLGSDFTMKNALDFTTGTAAFELTDGQTLNISGDKNVNIANSTFTGLGTVPSQINIEGNQINVGTITANNATISLNSAIKDESIITLKSENNGKIIINTDANLSYLNGDSVGAQNFEIGADKTVNLSGRISANLANITINSGATLESKGFSLTSTVGNNIIGSLTMEKDSTLIIAGGVRFGKANIDGTIRINGSGSTANINDDTFILGLTRTITFGENSQIIQTYIADGASNWARCSNLVVNAGTGKINLQNGLNLAKSTTVILNTTDAFVLGKDAVSQADSTFNIAMHYDTYTHSNNITSFEINAPNNIGSFNFGEDDHIISLAFGENGYLTVGEDSQLTSFTGDYLGENCIILKGNVYMRLKVYDLTESQILSYFKSEGSDIYVVDAGDGAYWVNNALIPEPSTFAAIFGIIAMAAAVRRKK